MGLFGWTSKIANNVNGTGGEKEEKKNIDAIINQYTTEDQPVTEFRGSDLKRDIIAAAETFASTYFNPIDNLGEIRDAKKTLESEMDNLEKLKLHNTENYKEKKKKREELNKFLESQAVFGNRVQFTKGVLRKNEETLFISFADFVRIIDKYGYRAPTKLELFSGRVSVRDVEILGKMKDLYSMKKYFGKWRLPKKGETVIDLVNKKPDLLNVFYAEEMNGTDHLCLVEVNKVSENDEKGKLKTVKSFKYSEYCLVRTTYSTQYHDDKYDNDRGYYSRSSVSYIKRDSQIKDIVKNGVFDIKSLELPENDDLFIGGYIPDVTSPLLIEADGQPPIAFFPWCDGIAIFRIFSDDALDIPNRLKFLYTGEK